MKTPLAFLFICLIFPTFLYSQIDTLYYDKSGKKVNSIHFADYYRVYLENQDSSLRYKFRDFYISGEVFRDGHFYFLDSLDDNNTRFSGKITTYYKNGKTSKECNYSNGNLNGSYFEYDQAGRLLISAEHIGGKLSGTYKKYNDDSSFKIIEYFEGKPVYDYYLMSDNMGNTLKFRIKDSTQIFESPDRTERFIEYDEGKPWQVYFKNGLTIAMNCSISKEYGKWYKADLTITNNSPSVIEFAPEKNMTAYSINKKNMRNDLVILTNDEYQKKIKRSQNWNMIMAGIGAGISAGAAGISTSTIQSYGVANPQVSMVTTYNPGATIQANMIAQQQIAYYGSAMENEKKVLQLGYFKKSTIYPGESISGYVNMKYIKGNYLLITININGAEYLYEWMFNKKEATPVE